MAKVSELTGARLDYWVWRARGGPHVSTPVPAYSTDWAQGGPLIEKHIDHLWQNGTKGWHARTLLRPVTRLNGCPCYGGDGNTPLQAICRAVVRSVFGDEVEDV